MFIYTKNVFTEVLKFIKDVGLLITDPAGKKFYQEDFPADLFLPGEGWKPAGQLIKMFIYFGRGGSLQGS